MELLESLEDDSAAIIFLDPPFNLGKTYARDVQLDKKPVENYLSWINSILNECMRVLAPGGALFLYHVPSWAIKFGAYLQSQLVFRHWIAISMKNGFARGKRLYPAHYALLYFTKGEPSYFHRPKLRPIRCRHCKEFIKDYGGYLPIVQKKG